MFDAYLSRWGLEPDGDLIVTPRARLLPVRRDGEAAMLKIATEPEEAYGGLLLSWWDGDGAARVFASEGNALLIERALGERSLIEMAQSGHDDEATRIMCNVMAKLHAPRDKPFPGLIPLTTWFRELEPVAATHGGILAQAAAIARDLLADQRDVVPLHGDVHHGNVLDFEERGWLVIDPKRVVGDRAFDYANVFCNPDMDFPEPAVATVPERFASRLAIVVARSGIGRRRMLQWIVAWTGLSAAWILGDGCDPKVDLRVAELALAELGL